MTRLANRPTVAPDRRFIRNLDWNLIKVFHEIAHNGGVTNAASAIARQQPAVSSALKRFEDYVGRALCQRGPGGFLLSDHGSRVAEIAGQIDRLVGLMEAELEAVEKDLTLPLHLATVGDVVSPRLDETIGRFARRFPKAELFIHVLPYPEIEEAIHAGVADVGICPEPRMLADLDYTFLCSETHRVVCGRTHSLAGTHVTDWSHLAGEAFVVPGTDEASIVREFRKRNGWGQTTAGQSLDIGEVKRLLRAGIGIALLPTEMVAREIEDGEFHALTDPIDGLSDDIFLVTNPDGQRHFAAERFLSMLPDEPPEPDCRAVA